MLSWNIATKPHSLWICYDDYTEDVEGYRRRRQLGKPTYYDEAYDLEYGPQTSPFDLQANPESDERPSQTFSHRDVSSDEYWRDDADDYELSQEVSLAEPLPHCDTRSKGQKVNPGYFSIGRPFDLAVLATDINEWDGAAGLKRDPMYKCLETLRFRLGDMLRARLNIEMV